MKNLKDRSCWAIAVTLALLSCCTAPAQTPSPWIPHGSVGGTGRILLRGGIGVATWDTKAEFRDIVVKTTEKTLYQSGFANNLDGWQSTGGEWAMNGGILTQNSRAINCQITTGGGDNTWTNYTYTLKARRTEGTEGFLIIFSAMGNPNVTYWWNIGGWGNTRTAIEKQMRTKNEIPGTAVDLRVETGTWYDIKIAIHDSTAECYFDGRLITTITDDKGTSTMPDVGRPTVVNNGNGPEPVTTTAGRGTRPTTTPRLDDQGNAVEIARFLGIDPPAGPITTPTVPAVSPAPLLQDPTSWIPKPNGCLIEQSGNKISITGVNNVSGWGFGNGIRTTRTLPSGSFYATVDFMVPQFRGGTALVYLRAHANTGIGNMVAILYQPSGSYQVQAWGINNTPNTFSRTSIRKIGDEDRAYHRMKLKYDAATQTAAGWVDDQFISTLKYEMSGDVYFELLANTDSKGAQIDLKFDNLTFTSDISQAPTTPDVPPPTIRDPNNPSSLWQTTPTPRPATGRPAMRGSGPGTM
jgi:hypothetical protein